MRISLRKLAVASAAVMGRHIGPARNRQGDTTAVAGMVADVAVGAGGFSWGFAPGFAIGFGAPFCGGH